MAGYELPDDPEALRAVLSEKLQSCISRMNAHDVNLYILKDEVHALKEANKTQDIFRAGDGTVKTAKWFGKLLIWIGSLSSAIYALYYAIVNWPHKGV